MSLTSKRVLPEHKTPIIPHDYKYPTWSVLQKCAILNRRSNTYAPDFMVPDSKSGKCTGKTLQVHAVYKNPYFTMHATTGVSTTSLLRIHIWYHKSCAMSECAMKIGDLNDTIIITITAQKCCSFLPSALLFILCTCQNTDGNKLVLFLCTIVIYYQVHLSAGSETLIHYVYLQPTNKVSATLLYLV